MRLDVGFSLLSPIFFYSNYVETRYFASIFFTRSYHYTNNV